MESKTLRPKRALLHLSAVALLILAATQARADAVSDLASFSVFDKVDLAQLANGDAKTMRGPQTSGRVLAVETVWVAPGSPSQVAAALKTWNPGQHPELKILMHGNNSDFSPLQKAPDNGAVRALVSKTASKSNELQISREEAAKLPAGGTTMAGPIASFWINLLSARAAAGPFGQPPYDYTGQNIRGGDEINAMLRQQAKIQKQFSGLISGKGAPYWELSDIEGTGVLTLGSSYARSGNGGTAQAADVLFYASGGFYAGITLHQMWPVDVGGRASTLVWRGDMTSAAEIGDARGIERLGAESAMMKDVSRTVRLFRRDTGGAR